MPVGTIHQGDIVVIDGERWTLVGMQGNQITLRNGGALQGMWLHELKTRDNVIIIPGDVRDNRPEMPDVDAFRDFDLTDPRELDRARRKLAHVNQILYGCTGGKDGSGERWAPWSPDIKVTVLDRLKLAELAKEPDLNIGSLKTIRKYRKIAESGAGLAGMIDPKFKKTSCAYGRCPTEIVDTLRDLYEQNTFESKLNSKDFFDALPEELAARYPEQWNDGTLQIPSRPTLYRVMERITGGRSRLFTQKARRSDANRPEPVSYSKLHALRPGHKVLLDTTPLDILACENGKDIALELTIAVDWYSRSLLAWSIHKVGAKDVDIGGLLGKILTPEPMRPQWKDNRRIAYQYIPLERDLSLADWFDKAAQHPAVWPDTLLIDRGRSYLNEAMLERCAQLGINVQPSRPYTPTDKAIVESTFRAISQMFCHHVKGYKGSDVLMRGKNVEGFWSCAQLEEFFAEWVLTVWQVHQHDGLRSEWDHDFKMTPNEKYAEGVASAGYLPLFATEDLYTLLLPCKWVTITDKGIKVQNLIYRNAWTRQQRGEKSAVGHKNGRWAVRWDPRDRQGIKVIDHRTDDIIDVPWIGRSIYSLPFADTRLREARRLAKDRKKGQPAYDADIALALRELNAKANPSTRKAHDAAERLKTTDDLQTGASLADQDRLRDALAKPGKPVLVEDDIEPDTDDDLTDEVDVDAVAVLPKFGKTSTAQRRPPQRNKKEESA